MKIKRSIKSNRGFSLVECVLALGVLSFAFIPLIGLLPVGLDQFRVSKQETIRGEILKFIDTQIQQTEYADMRSSAPTGMENASFAFDEQGLPVDMSSPQRVFVARTSLSPLGVLLPANPAPVEHASFTGVTVNIYRQPANVTENNALPLYQSALYASDRGQ